MAEFRQGPRNYSSKIILKATFEEYKKSSIHPVLTLGKQLLVHDDTTEELQPASWT